MNCKPGDIAIVIGESIYAGRLFEVLYAAPTGAVFRLPDGKLHDPAEPEHWVLRSIGTPVPAPVGKLGMTRLAMYGCGADKKLRPLGGITEQIDEQPGCEVGP